MCGDTFASLTQLIRAVDDEHKLPGLEEFLQGGHRVCTLPGTGDLPSRRCLVKNERKMGLKMRGKSARSLLPDGPDFS